MSLHVQYDTQDENGETRRERNARFGVASPEIDRTGIEAGEYLLDAFWRLSRLRSSGMNGPDAIQPGAVRDWCSVTGTRLYAEEIEIIFDIDAAYRAAWHDEMARRDD